MCDCGKIIVISGPSGAGKSTVIARLMERNPNIVFSVSVTTRSPRAGERDGCDYCFVDKETFDGMVERNELLEYARYVDNYYGSPRQSVVDSLSAGRDVLFDIEVQGAMQIKRACPDAILVFMIPSTADQLEKRLRARGTDSEETISKRLKQAANECRYAPDYKYLVLNDSTDTAVSELEAILTAEKCRMDERKNYLLEVCSK
jgi:guanylate kinase